MNKVITTTLTVVMALFLALNASAVEKPFSLYVSKSSENKKIVLRLENMFADQVKCRIYSEFGGLVFSDAIYTAEKTAKKYDLSQLPEGNYFIEIVDLMKVERLKITVNRDGVDFNNPVADITYKPTIWLNNNKHVDFNLLSLGNDVTIRIIDEYNVEILNQNFNDQNTIAKRYDLSKLPTGTYTFEVSNGDEVFYNYLSI